eukprot:CAMPEP_0119058022 /NCGR_PEP_ID=MMETSP1178-20130426/2391_1 /TAXON_ID=33656 /ORGANISM="unid sp, Strain CCMP2000" /LENGTH=124 /DNA_ID=CAMNT_0007038911 /DNA_START=288 /DNA_END=664 /DNA_ORIENTATION=+
MKRRGGPTSKDEERSGNVETVHCAATQDVEQIALRDAIQANAEGKARSDAKNFDGTFLPMPSTTESGYSLSPHQVSTVSSSMTGATCLTGSAERRATAGRTPAAGAKAEHEPRSAKITLSFMST